MSEVRTPNKRWLFYSISETKIARMKIRQDAEGSYAMFHSYLMYNLAVKNIITQCPIKQATDSVVWAISIHRVWQHKKPNNYRWFPGKVKPKENEYWQDILKRKRLTWKKGNVQSNRENKGNIKEKWWTNLSEFQRKWKKKDKE